ncbi:hypothetical protein [Actinomadura litoris]|uniref:hypothetical protein n=1 Tax=Actinomadura litoris TaxID=2678616 RepID=UPI001FA6C225|nr:hypothetical protein [Actinomadura litoris]
MGHVEQLEGWLKRDNLKGFLLIISEVIGYRFDISDWGAFQATLEPSNQGDDWFDYPLVGEIPIRIEMSYLDDEGDIGLKIFTPADEPCVRKQIQTAWMVFNRLDVSPEVQLIE